MVTAKLSPIELMPKQQRDAKNRRNGRRSAAKTKGKFVAKGKANSGKFPAEWEKRANA
jgi:hypothetical protein